LVEDIVDGFGETHEYFYLGNVQTSNVGLFFVLEGDEANAVQLGHHDIRLYLNANKP
jgi:hypothetical protein